MGLKRFVLLLLAFIYVFYYVTSSKRPSNFQEFKSKNFYQSYSSFEKCNPKEFLQPKSLEELITIIKDSNDKNIKVKVAGSGHSLNSIGMTNGILLNLDFLKKVVYIDQDKKQISVEAGIRLKDLSEILDQNGLALPSLGSICEQSIAGAISTATHGTSSLKNDSKFQHTSLSSLVVALEVIDSSGIIHFANHEKNQDIFNAGRVSLGSIGIIYKVTLQCVDKFNLEKREYLDTIDNFMKNYKSILNEYDFVKFWWIPYTDKAKIILEKKTSEIVPEKSIIQQFLKRIEAPILVTLLELGRIIGSINLHQYVFTNVLAIPVHEISKSFESFSIIPFTTAPAQPFAMEFFVPFKDFEASFQELRKAINESRIQTNFWNEVRFIGKEDIWMSPFKEDSVSFDLGLHNRNINEWRQFLQVIDQVLKKYHYRAHWGKSFIKTKQDIQKEYPKVKEFIQVQKSLDPKGIFLNDYHDIFLE